MENSKSNITHRNHYVSKFYLKNWSLDGNTVQTYSILVSNAKVPYWTRQSIKNSAVWNDFYTRMEGGQEVDDFEHWFDREFEDPAKPVFDKLLSEQKLSCDESTVLSRFVLAQYIRTPAAYIRIMGQSRQVLPGAIKRTEVKLDKALKKTRKGPLTAPNGKDEIFFPIKVTTFSEQGIIEVKSTIGRGFFLHMLKRLMSSTIKKLGPYSWQLLRASEGISFPTSDDPVICLNYMNDFNYNFNGGLGKKNCNIFMPISPKALILTQVGDNRHYDSRDLSPQESLLFRKMIIQHAHRYVYADRPQKGMLALNPRIVDLDRYKQEESEMAGWHVAQIQAEQNL